MRAADEIEHHLRWALRLTLAGLWIEALARAFWPLFSLALFILSAAAFGIGPENGLTWGALGLMLLGCLAYAWRFFARPSWARARARLDHSLEGQPLSTLHDQQAIGSDDPQSRALWQAHLARVAAQSAHARAVPPTLALETRDPLGLRYLAMTAAVIAGLFAPQTGGWWPAPFSARSAQAVGFAPDWEAWLSPPLYTGRPVIYLNEITQSALSAPLGSLIHIRAYRADALPKLFENITADGGKPASDPAQMFELSLSRSGTLRLDDREWQITALPDQPPEVRAEGKIEREPSGLMKLGFQASDDYGVSAGQAVITLDLARVDRRYGLALPPEEIAPLTLPLPLPLAGRRSAFSQILREDLSRHVLANLPVTLDLSVSDAAGQQGHAPPLPILLPGKRFFDPMAAAVIELRRALLWNRANAAKVAQIARAISHPPDELALQDSVIDELRALARRLETEPLTTEARDEISLALWDLAMRLEEGDLTSASERLARAQARLDEAIRNGADPAEIAELMEELRRATDAYLDERAKADQQRETDRKDDENQLSLGEDQLQQLLQKLEELLREGRMEEAAELMEKLRQLMQNLEVQEGASGSGSGQGGEGQGGSAMRELSEQLREQQNLSDDAYSDYQNQQPYNRPPESAPQRPEQGEGSLRERQKDLRERLGQLPQNNLPGAGSREGEAGREALERAGEAMREAEEALREGDLPRALDHQAEAMNQMREGIRALNEAARRDANQQSAEAPEAGEQSSPRDPLGRNLGENGVTGESQSDLLGSDPHRRAQGLIDEIRRRQSEQGRSARERDYLERLLDQF